MGAGSDFLEDFDALLSLDVRLGKGLKAINSRFQLLNIMDIVILHFRQIVVIVDMN